MSVEAAVKGQEHYSQISQATEHQKAGRLLEAKNIYLNLLAGNPDDANALHLLGMLSHQAGDSEQGAELIEKAVKLLPDFPLFLNNLGHVQLSLYKLEKAEDAFTQAMHLDSNMVESLYGLAECYRRKGDLQRAAGNLQLVLESAPQHTDAIVSLGQIHLQYGTTEKALELFGIALQIESEHFDARFHLARAYAAALEYEKSIEVFLRLLNERPEHVPSYNNLGNVYMAMLQFDKAQQAYQNVVDHDPDDVGMRYNIALANVALNQKSIAIEHLEHALTIDADNIRVQQLLSDLKKNFQLN